jgi:hypothetical protein
MERVNQGQSSKYNVLSILGFIFAFIIPPVGFILGIVALVHINKTGEKGKGLAIAAVVLGAIFFFILIFIVLVGIMWVVVKSNVQDDSLLGSENFNSMCLSANVVATRVIDSGNGVFDVTLARQGGEDELGGVKLAFTNNDESTSYVADVSGNIRALMSKTASITIPSGDLPNPNRVSVVVYFLDDSGNAQLCSTANQLSF